MAKNFISNKDESVRMFDSNFLDFFSRVHFTVPLILFIPVVLYFLYKAIFVFHIAALPLVGYFAIGFLVWTFAEYTLHRFVFHFHHDSDFGRKMHFIFHGVHHDYPNDTYRLVMVPSMSVPLAFVFYGLFYLILGAELASAIFPGFVAGYLTYDMTHYVVHHANWKNQYFQNLKKHHILHHFKYPDQGYGVSSTLWDKVFGSTYPKEEG